MQRWSIFSDNVRYVQHDKMVTPDLDIDTLDYHDHKDVYFQMENKKGEALDIDLVNTLMSLKLDI